MILILKIDNVIDVLKSDERMLLSDVYSFNLNKDKKYSKIWLLIKVLFE